MNIRQQKKQYASYSIFLTLLYIISIILYLYLVIDGFDFYTTSLKERPRHKEYRNLRPAGAGGHAFGVIGSLMMMLMLLYSVRKRTRFFRNFLPVSFWLQIHIFLGIMGPLLIILHTAFKVQGLVAVSFWSMIAVALSGVLGRYLYMQIPRTISGHEINLNELEKSNAEMARRLREQFGLREETQQEIESQFMKEMKEKRNLLALLFSMILLDVQRPLKVAAIKRKIALEYQLPPQTIKEMAHLIQRKALMHRRVNLWNGVHRLFHYWHIIHKPFALIMYLIMFVHIGIAVWFGYVWIF